MKTKLKNLRRKRRSVKSQKLQEQFSTGGQTILPLPNENSISYCGNKWPRNPQKCMSVVRQDNFSWNIIHWCKHIMFYQTNIQRWHIMQILHSYHNWYFNQAFKFIFNKCLMISMPLTYMFFLPLICKLEETNLSQKKTKTAAWFSMT